jgi:hypothetical protein
MGRLLFAATLAVGVLLASCTKSTETAATQAAGAVCEVIFAAEDPALAPLCTTAAQLAEALEAVLAASSADASVQGIAPVRPLVVDRTAVYEWLKAHGAQPVTP